MTDERGKTTTMLQKDCYIADLERLISARKAVKVNRLIVIAIILTAIAADLQAQQPTPARRASSSTSTTKSPAAVNSSSRRAQPASSSVKTAVASKTNTAGAIGTSVQRANSKVVKASAMQEEVIYDEHLVPTPDASVVYESAPNAGCSSCSSGGCDGTCEAPTFAAPSFRGFSICNPPPGARQLCICLPSHGWAQFDYLSWYPSGMDIPTLATTDTVAPIDGFFSTGTPLVSDELLTEQLNGGRLRAGWWFANNPNLGIELEYFRTETNEFAFSETVGVNGRTFLARPYFDLSNFTGRPNLENASHVDSITINASSRLQGGGVKFRKLLCCGDECKQSWIFCRPVSTQSRVDATAGWRTLELNETLSIGTTDRDTVANVTATARDSFEAQNIFNGGELGFMWQGRRGYWTLDVLLRTAFGNTNSEVTIDGSTTFSSNGITRAGGLLALPSNINTYTSNQFSVVPEVGATLGYQLTERTRLTVGYTMIYWTNVARPGDQIDTDVNPTFIPNEFAAGTQTGIRRPGLPEIELTNYFIHGFNVGGEYRW